MSEPTLRQLLTEILVELKVQTELLEQMQPDTETDPNLTLDDDYDTDEGLTL